MENNYDRIAPIYDQLSRLVFGKRWAYSKEAHLDQITKGATVLYCGGGSGANLPILLDHIGTDGAIYYVETSPKMMAIAQKRCSSVNLHFHQSLDRVSGVGQIDFVVTQYFLDVLRDDDIELFFRQVEKIISPDSAWIMADFFPKPHRKTLLGMMIFLFRKLINHPRQDLPDYDKFFVRYGWEVVAQQTWDRGFIVSRLYRKG